MKPYINSSYTSEPDTAATESHFNSEAEAAIDAINRRGNDGHSIAKPRTRWFAERYVDKSVDRRIMFN
jgi:hypothetical protein